MSEEKKYIGYTEEGYGIISEFDFKGGKARCVDFPSPPPPPEMDAEEKWWEEKVLRFITSEEYDELDLKIFDYQNFHPKECGKDVGSGSWVRVKTDTGWNVYFAKKARRFIDVSQISRKMKKLSKSIPQTDGTDSLVELQEGLGKLDTIKKEIEKNEKLLTTAKHLEGMDIQPEYISVQRTRTQKMYLLPNEYEIVSDISLYSEAVIKDKKTGAVKFKALFTAQDYDAIFYLQSRGISKENAIMMAKMKHGYFAIDRNALVDNVFTLVE